MTIRALIPALALVFACTWANASELVRTAHFQFTTADGKAAIAHELSAGAEVMLRQVSAALGVEPAGMPRISVDIHHGSESFLAEIGHNKAIEWAAGIAWPAKRKILLRIDAQTRFTIHDIFRHEVSHVMLHRAIGGNHVPRWFHEGIAVHQAGEQILQRWRRTAEASLSDGLIPFAALENGFPANGLRADLAYAQSTAYVGFLLEQHGWGAMRVILRRIHEGMGFGGAIRTVFGKNLRQIELEWRAALDRRASWVPFLTGTGILWVAISTLFLLSWAINRRRVRARLSTMDDPNWDDEFA